MHFTLKQLRYFVALVETGHFGRAAERCNITQPALSQQIRQLEESFGRPLIDRLGRMATPTPVGRDVLAQARAVLDAADALEAFAQGAIGAPQRPLRFGLIPTVAPYLLPDIYPLLTAAFPSVSFSISEGRTELLLAELSDGRLDLALVASPAPPGGPRLVSVALREDPFVLATPPGEARVAPIALSDIDRSRMLLLDEGHCLRDQAIAACGLPEGAGGRTFAATSLSTIVEFVASGQGITLLPSIALRKEAADGRIAIHPLAPPGAGRMLSLVWREAAPHRDLFQAVATTLRDGLNPLPSAPFSPDQSNSVFSGSSPG
ncbi:LysR family transcriptional regulator, hydrogen peroxide-inducible genes activator [Devosia enhydra]|uniref:LysR family transcriptional regulator, hydrogen peroxide-inducible genes activator n=1 Tax=Devosia enhydra TaxID=665118 RepID=A0A1K2HWB5_9HYPH|nr:hydrogen peroxide-inducible genes activator [Devosia enhydra]SFZ82921.1 LysR family transcriptional regulator, hydrogen peroxide-inducible genes activator [Devosia enhydra]